MDNTPSADATSLLRVYEQAFDRWLDHGGTARRVDRETSIGVYRAMWTSLTKWAVAQQPPLAPEALTDTDLQRFLDKRAETGQPADLSPRYVWRLLHLVDRVLGHHARRHPHGACSAAMALLQTRPEWEYANAADKNPPPDCLTPPLTRQLVQYLSAARPRPGRLSAEHPWQDLRNRALVAVMLGAGVTPGEARELCNRDVLWDENLQQRLPAQLHIAAHERTPARQAPLAGWAGHVLAHWMATRAAEPIPGEHLFVSTRSGKPIGKVAQYEAVQRILNASGLPPAVVTGGSYRLRHTFAVRQLRRGIDPAQVAHWLGIDASEMSRYQRLIHRPI